MTWLAGTTTAVRLGPEVTVTVAVPLMGLGAALPDVAALAVTVAEPPPEVGAVYIPVPLSVPMPARAQE